MSLFQPTELQESVRCKEKSNNKKQFNVKK